VQNRKLIIEPSVSGVTLTLLTSMFLHAGPWHLLGNMLFFWIFGNNIEDRLGHVLFTLFYLLGGIAATLCHWLMSSAPFDAVPMIGASGAVAVMMGAYIVTYPKANIRVLFLLGCIPLFFEVPAMLVLAFWIGEQLLAAYWQQQGFVTDVALWAHIGGFAIGAAFMPLLSAGTPEPTQDWKREADEQFDYEHVDPSRPRRPPVADDRGIWWEEPPRREPPGYQRRSPWEDPP